MANLSNIYRSKVKSTRYKNKDSTLLGELFITIIEDNIVDIANGNKLVVNNVVPTSSITNLNKKNSIYFIGDDSNIKIEETGIFYFGLEDFTIDWWEYKFIPQENTVSTISTNQCSLCKCSKFKKLPIMIKNSNGQCIYISSNGLNYDIAYKKYIGDVSYDIWTHWAIVRCNNNFYTYRDGIIKNIWISNKPIDSSEEALIIGSTIDGGNFYGCMSNIRVVKGQALWTEEFKLTNEELFY